MRKVLATLFIFMSSFLPASIALATAMDDLFDEMCKGVFAREQREILESAFRILRAHQQGREYMEASEKPSRPLAPAWDLPLASGTYIEGADGRSAQKKIHSFPQIPEVVFEDEAQNISLETHQYIEEASGRVSMFFMVAQKHLPKIVRLRMNDDPAEGASVLVENAVFFLPKRWLQNANRNEIIATMAHEFGHIVYSYYVEAKFKEAGITGYSNHYKNRYYNMLRPISEVFADVAAVIAVGSPEAISALMPAESFDRIVRNFSFTEWHKLILTPGFAEIYDRDVHIQSRLRSVIWKRYLEDVTPVKNAFSLSFNAMHILDALTPIRWFEIIEEFDGEPRILQLVATLAIEYFTETFTVDTTRSILLRFFADHMELLAEYLLVGASPVVETIAQSPALVKVLYDAGQLDLLKVAISVLEASKVESMMIHYGASLFAARLGKANIAAEIEMAKETHTITKSRTVAGPTLTEVYREATPGYTEVHRSAKPIESRAELEDTVELEVESESQNYRTMGGGY